MPQCGSPAKIIIITIFIGYITVKHSLIVLLAINVKEILYIDAYNWIFYLRSDASFFLPGLF